jgi:hypothetical protein
MLRRPGAAEKSGAWIGVGAKTQMRMRLYFSDCKGGRSDIARVRGGQPMWAG